MAIALRRSTARDIPFITALERHPDNVPFIGQWSDWEHLSAIDRRNGREHWIIERDGAPSGYLIAFDCRARDAGKRPTTTRSACAWISERRSGSVAPACRRGARSW